MAGRVPDANAVMLAFERGRAFDGLLELRQSDAPEHGALTFEPLVNDDLVRAKDGAADRIERQGAQDARPTSKGAGVPGAQSEGDRTEA